jgi:hypothetical protein
MRSALGGWGAGEDGGGSLICAGGGIWVVFGGWWMDYFNVLLVIPSMVGEAMHNESACLYS